MGGRNPFWPDDMAEVILYTYDHDDNKARLKPAEPGEGSVSYAYLNSTDTMDFFTVKLKKNKDYMIMSYSDDAEPNLALYDEDGYLMSYQSISSIGIIEDPGYTTIVYDPPYTGTYLVSANWYYPSSPLTGAIGVTVGIMDNTSLIV